MGSCKACNSLAVTVAVFLILSAVWMWTHHPRLNVPPRSPLPAYPGTSEHKKLQEEWGLPLSLPGIRTYEKKIKSKPVERNQLLSSITSYTKLNISFERIKIDSSSSSVFISLRTTVAFHKSRLLLLLLTWLQTVNPKQVCIRLSSFTYFLMAESVHVVQVNIITLSEVMYFANHVDFSFNLNYYCAA